MDSVVLRDETKRYQLVSGKYGFYYKDTKAGVDLTLEDVLRLLHEHEVYRRSAEGETKDGPFVS
jgi:hypothetical protein